MTHEVIRAALQRATETLKSVTATARLDAELLMADALGCDRDRLLIYHLDDPVPKGFEERVARRLAREPVAYITGERDFWTLRLAVTPDVLIPRPDSETLIEAAIAHFQSQHGTGPEEILDLGTGSGALLLAALDHWPNAHGLGIDASDAALAVAKGNAQSTGLEPRATFQSGHWADGLAGPYDLILCNPPYIRDDAELSPEVLSEPHQALFAGDDGLADYRLLAPQVAHLLSPTGCACFEIGATQAPDVTALLESAGLSVNAHSDLAGITRCLRATLLCQSETDEG